MNTLAENDEETVPGKEHVLPALGMLKQLSVRTRREMSHAGKFQVAPKGTKVARQGVNHRMLWVVLSGRLRVTCHAHGDHVDLAMLGPGDIVGEMSLLDHQPSSADVTVIDRPGAALRRKGVLQAGKGRRGGHPSKPSVRSSLPWRVPKCGVQLTSQVGAIIGTRRLDAPNRKAGDSQRLVDEGITRHSIRPGVASVVQLHGAQHFPGLRMTKHEINVLGLDPVEGPPPGSSILAGDDFDEIRQPHLAEDRQTSLNGILQGIEKTLLTGGEKRHCLVGILVDDRPPRPEEPEEPAEQQAGKQAQGQRIESKRFIEQESHALYYLDFSIFSIFKVFIISHARRPIFTSS